MRSTLLLAWAVITTTTHGTPHKRPSSLHPRAPSDDYTFLSMTAINAMNNAFYDPSAARWTPADAWWLSGVALTNLVNYMLKTGTPDYLGQSLSIFSAQRAPLPWWPEGNGEFRADSTDDTGWWALAMIRLYDLTGDSTFLDIARKDEEYMYAYWTEKECAGGMYVDIKAKTYKNAIANELYIKLAASLHNRIEGDTLYLSRAIRAWEWLAGSGMRNSQGLFNDGLAGRQDGTCFNNGLPVWTYNQGVIIGALAELYLSTTNLTLLANAKSIADAVLSNPPLNSRGGVLTDPACEPPLENKSEDTCNNDQQIFKGIFAANLDELAAILRQTGIDGSAANRYRGYLLQNARVMLERDTDGQGLYDVSWAGPFRSSTIAKQASAVALLVSLI